MDPIDRAERWLHMSVTAGVGAAILADLTALAEAFAIITVVAAFGASAYYGLDVYWSYQDRQQDL